MLYFLSSISLHNGPLKHVSVISEARGISTALETRLQADFASEFSEKLQLLEQNNPTWMTSCILHGQILQEVWAGQEHLEVSFVLMRVKLYFGTATEYTTRCELKVD